MVWLPLKFVSPKCTVYVLSSFFDHFFKVCLAKGVDTGGVAFPSKGNDSRAASRVCGVVCRARGCRVVKATTQRLQCAPSETAPKQNRDGDKWYIICVMELRVPLLW